jgi:hypothetical protein
MSNSAELLIMKIDATYWMLIILAAAMIFITLPRGGYGGNRAECSMIRDMVSQLHTAKAIYEKETGKKAKGFKDFVEFKSETPTQPYTITLKNWDTDCRFVGSTVYCPLANFRQYKDVYFTWRNGEIYFLAPTPRGNNLTCPRPLSPCTGLRVL